MKRFWAFILVMLVAATALTPCCTAEEHHGGVAASQQHDQQGEDGCTCSPFFACATCPGFIPTAKPIVILPPLAPRLSWYEEVLHYIPSTYTTVPWQPPRTA